MLTTSSEITEFQPKISSLWSIMISPTIEEVKKLIDIIKKYYIIIPNISYHIYIFNILNK